jgi:5-methylcytosine-specific restriction endonuclease McrA
VLRVAVSSAFVKDLKAVRQALSHKFPAGGLEEVLHECLRMTLEKIERRRRGAGKKRAAKAPPEDSSYIPAAVRYEVWQRDEGRCTYVSAGGHRCNSDHQVQMHHLDPRAKGGEATAKNITLRCRMHNIYAAEHDYGRAFVAQKIAARRGRGKP